MRQQPTLAASPKGSSLSTDGADPASIDIIFEVYWVRNRKKALNFCSLPNDILRTGRNDSKVHSELFRKPLVLVHSSNFLMNQDHAVLACRLAKGTLWHRRLHFHEVCALGNDVGVDPYNGNHSRPRLPHSSHLHRSQDPSAACCLQNQATSAEKSY